MRPMSLFESGSSTGQVSLAALLDGDDAPVPDTGMTVPVLAELVTVGGWPANQELDVGGAARAARDYLAQIRDVDVSRVDGVRRDPQRVQRLLRSLAHNVATEVNVSVLAADAGGDEGPLARQTVYDYLDVLARVMVIEDQPAWSPHLRSKATLRSSPKRHFVDPSLAMAALGALPERLLADLNLFGLLFESLVVRDLRVFAQPLDGVVYHYRDSYGLEVDAIVQLSDGRWGAFEVELGAGLVEGGAATLLDFASRIDTERSGSPEVLAVISGTGYGYRRDDGVVVIPIGALGP